MDGVFVACTSLRVAALVEDLEAELGKPVTSSNHAMAWHALRLGRIAEALDGPDAIWISLDIDVVDPGLAPGTGTPEPGGLLTRELLRALRQIASAVPVAGMDIVEVSPPYDWAESTAMIANRAALEVISALAKRKSAGERIRWEGQR